MLVEDSEDDAILILHELRRGGYGPRHERVDTLGAFNAALDSGDWDLVIADYNMPRFGALGALSALQGKTLDIPFVVVSGAIGEDLAVAAMKAGAHDYIMKSNLARLVPAIQRELREARLRSAQRQGEQALQRAFEEIDQLRKQLEMENAYLREEIRSDWSRCIVGESAVLRKLIEQTDAIAPTDANALIQGETGAGKELVAWRIHEKSPRKNRPYVKVNCGAIPENLFESEFFGHVKGAFTGAIQNRTGRFQLAHRGVLFLDEVSEIPLALQSKLLRVLQEGQFEPVGDDKTRQVDVRVISATNRDLLEEVRAGRFREDLYYRLNVVSLYVPPLRQRKGDIPLLAKQFLELAHGKYRLKEIKLNPSALEQLQLHDWPGNIRELQNAVERAYIVCQGDPLRFDLPAKRGPWEIQDGAGIAERDPSGKTAVPAEEIKRQEYCNVLKALEQTQWKIYGPGGAAELLGIKASTLAYRIKKMGIKKPD